MSHFVSVFKNLCVKVPIDPITKMPIASYERKFKRSEQRKTNKSKRCSIDSMSSDCSLIKTDMDARQVKEFYQSIPDYKEIHHLTEEEFYSTLRALREKKTEMLGYNLSHIDDENGNMKIRSHESLVPGRSVPIKTKVPDIPLKTDYTKHCCKNDSFTSGVVYSSKIKKITDDIDSILADTAVNESPKSKKLLDKCDSDRKPTTAGEVSPEINISKEPVLRSESRTKRNHSACSISWNDQCAGGTEVNDVDSRFEKYFRGVQFSGKQRKSRSMPTSPTKVRGMVSPVRHRKGSCTIPKPFNMTLRDDDSRTCNTLKCLGKSFSEEMLNRKCSRKRFRARPVPIESRIPLYEKIMEDQAMRRAISKINSTAELQAQMKPFSFTEREELCKSQVSPAAAAAAGTGPAATVEPAGTSKKLFRARPVPKHLFSSGLHEKVKEEEFFRSLNRRIRAEELLRKASLPPSMAARDRSGLRSRLSTPGGLLSDLPTDTTSEMSSNKSGKRRRKRNSAKIKRQTPKDFITTSPQPFKFSTAYRDRVKSNEETKRIYSKGQSSPPRTATAAASTRAASALDAPSVTRSNLAAVLRIESTKQRLEREVERRSAELQQRAEQRWRDHALRKKPAWQLVKNNYQEDIAMRLQTRRDEERLRREEFLHEMELMYGRVRDQPLLFERYYTPKSIKNLARAVSQEIHPSLEHGNHSQSRQVTPNARSHKVSANEDAETKSGDLLEYLDRLANDEKLYCGTDSLSDLSTKSTKDPHT